MMYKEKTRYIMKKQNLEKNRIKNVYTKQERKQIKNRKIQKNIAKTGEMC